MNERVFFWVLNAALVLIIYVNSEVGRMLGLTGFPLHISVVWPPTGFALAATLMYGPRAIPGVFLGNLLYNGLHFYLEATSLVTPGIAACVVSLGSTVQAYVGGSVLRRVCPNGPLESVRDVVLFLLFGGIITCLIAPTVGIATLILYSGMGWERIELTWLSFWIGDTMGVYVLTPLLVAWTAMPAVGWYRYRWEVGPMVIVLAGALWLALVPSYAIALPLLLVTVWIAYRLRMRGITAAIFLIAIASIAATANGYGAFVGILPTTALTHIVIFLEALIVVSLLFAAIVKERDDALMLAGNRELFMQERDVLQAKRLREYASSIVVKEKRATIGLLAADVARQIQIPLRGISHFLKASQECVSHLTHMPTDTRAALDNYLHNIDQLGTEAHTMARLLESHPLLSGHPERHVKPININTLLTISLKKAAREVATEHPAFSYATDKEFMAEMEVALPDDLIYAFVPLFQCAIQSMKAKHDLQGAGYAPQLVVHTQNVDGQVRVTIRDNGLAIKRAVLGSYFAPPACLQPHERIARTAIALARDIIVHIYGGTLHVDPKEGKYLQVTVTLPS